MIGGAVARVPVAFLLAGMAVTLTAWGLQATDELTAAVTGSIGQDTSAFLTNVGHMVVAGGDTSLVFIAIGSILLIKGFLEQNGVNVEPTRLALWAMPTAVAAWVIHNARLLLLDRSLRRELTSTPDAARPSEDAA